uniref:Ras and Rab interactor-like protein n=1 Tax=Sphenodon punctatus TaxID=8508 RepID=A0A8D0L2I9_SPHPU
MKFWTVPLKPRDTPLAMAAEETMGSSAGPPELQLPTCSIQVTSEDGAMCIINPLFLAVHSDADWLGHSLPPCQTADAGRKALRPRNGLENLQEPGSTEEGETGLQELPKGAPRKGDVSSASRRRRLLLRSPAQSASVGPPDGPPSPEPPRPETHSPHRASWIEEAPEATAPAPCHPLKKSHSESSLLGDALLPVMELDSLSVSSVEDEAEAHTAAPATPSHRKRHSAVLTSKVLHRISAVGSALSGLLSAERRVSNRVQELAQEPGSYVGGLVQSYVAHVLQGGAARHTSSTEMLQEIRQTISNLKGYLCESSELQAGGEQGDTEEMDLGSVVEASLYKCLLKPLRDCVYAQLLDFHTQDGLQRRLHDHQATMRKQSLAELGVAAGVPDGPALERIQAKLGLLHQAYSPKKKETLLLKVCKMLYEAMNQGAGRAEPFGADDFLPVLIYTLVQGDVVPVQLDVEYMMELMDPGQLQGEGGYYLTTWFGALYHIGNYQPATMVTRHISIEAQRTIHQWQRRRTIHHREGYRRRSQDILYISFQEPFANQKAIPVPFHMTAASVCVACAEKYGIADPASYGLFLVMDSTSRLLSGDSCPQKLRAELLRSRGTSVCFVYKLKGRGELPATGAPALENQRSTYNDPA